jgi:hypothetical protein
MIYQPIEVVQCIYIVIDSWQSNKTFPCDIDAKKAFAGISGLHSGIVGDQTRDTNIANSKSACTMVGIN